MPHLRFQISRIGPLIDFQVGLSKPHADILLADGKQVPTPVSVRGLVDTGASGTALDPSIINSLNLTPTGSIPVHTPSTGTTPHYCDQYDVALLLPLPGGMHYQFPALPVIASDLQAQGIQALIGRDVLARGVLIYDGFAGTFTLGF